LLSLVGRRRAVPYPYLHDTAGSLFGTVLEFASFVMANQTIQPARTISGAVEVPGDKSISHRYAILAALAEGRSEIVHYSAAADCWSTLACLTRLGVSVEKNAKTIAGDGAAGVAITGAGLDGLRHPSGALDAGNSGTTMRLLAGVLAGQRFDSTLTGDASLRRRPMRRIMEPLARMGARIEARDANFAPLEIHGSALRPTDYTLPVASAQVKSAMLLAGLFADGETNIEEPVRTRDHSELALAEFGADIRRAGRVVRITGRPRLEPRRLAVPGDLSSAVFFLAAALVLPDSVILAQNVGLNPTRAAVLDVLAGWGAPVNIVSVRSEAGELVGDVTVRHAQLSGGVIAGDTVAQVIDELPMLAALGPYTEQGVEIRDATELRVKESDRIAVLAENLRQMGASVEERLDGLRVAGRSGGRLHGAQIDPHGDHRIAMAFSVAALGATSETTISDADCAAVSYPDFFPVLERLVSI
jgi:3-phosphoshikimate 1-carboxyvinyltransferase